MFFVFLAMTIEVFSRLLGDEPLHLIVLDGSWKEASSIKHNFKMLNHIPKVD